MFALPAAAQQQIGTTRSVTPTAHGSLPACAFTTSPPWTLCQTPASDSTNSFMTRTAGGKAVLDKARGFRLSTGAQGGNRNYQVNRLRLAFAAEERESSILKPRSPAARIKSAFERRATPLCRWGARSAKGRGAARTIGAPAIMNAVEGALTPLGTVVIDMPATSERVWRVLASYDKCQLAL